MSIAAFEFGDVNLAAAQDMFALNLQLIGTVGPGPNEPSDPGDVVTSLRYNANPMSILAAASAQNMGALSLAVIGTVSTAEPTDPPGYRVLHLYIKEVDGLKRVLSSISE